MYICIYTYIYTYTRTHVYVYMYMYTYTCTHVHIHTHIYVLTLEELHQRLAQRTQKFNVQKRTRGKQKHTEHTNRFE